jgi:hypothetical protein
MNLNLAAMTSRSFPRAKSRRTPPPGRQSQLLASLLVLTASLSPAQGDQGLTLSTPSVFRYVAPPGWTSQVAGGYALGGFPQAVGPAAHNFTPDITFITAGYHPLDAFVKSYAPKLVDLTGTQNFPLKLVEVTPFRTAAGVNGYRLHSIDPSNPPAAEQFAYVFTNPDGLVYEFACACAPADADKDLPIFDASMKTVQILRAGG